MSLLITQVEPHQADWQFPMRQTHTGTFLPPRYTCVHGIVLGSEEGGMMARQAVAAASGPCTAPETAEPCSGSLKPLTGNLCSGLRATLRCRENQGRGQGRENSLVGPGGERTLR